MGLNTWYDSLNSGKRFVLFFLLIAVPFSFACNMHISMPAWLRAAILIPILLWTIYRIIKSITR